MRFVILGKKAFVITGRIIATVRAETRYWACTKYLLHGRSDFDSPRLFDLNVATLIPLITGGDLFLVLKFEINR